MPITNAQWASCMRSLADFYEAHPEIPHPLYHWLDYFAIHSLSTKEEAAALVRALSSANKIFEGDTFTIQKEMGGVSVRWFFSRAAVCERVVVGTRYEPEHEIPAKPAEIVPAREIEVIEYRCQPLLSPSRGPEPTAPELPPAPQLQLMGGDDDIPF